MCYKILSLQNPWGFAVYAKSLWHSMQHTQRVIFHEICEPQHSICLEKTAWTGKTNPPLFKTKHINAPEYSAKTENNFIKCSMSSYWPNQEGKEKREKWMINNTQISQVIFMLLGTHTADLWGFFWNKGLIAWMVQEKQIYCISNLPSAGKFRVFMWLQHIKNICFTAKF